MNRPIALLLFLASVCTLSQNALAVTIHSYASVEMVDRPGGIKPIAVNVNESQFMKLQSSKYNSSNGAVQVIGNKYSVSSKSENHVQASKYLAQYE